MTFNLRAHCISVSYLCFLILVIRVWFSRASTSGCVNSVMRLSYVLMYCSEEQRREEKREPNVSSSNQPLGRPRRIYPFSQMHSEKECTSDTNASHRT